MSEKLQPTQCGSCKYFAALAIGADECRRRSPKVVPPQYQIGAGSHPRLLISRTTIWPNVKETDWCGEYEKHPKYRVFRFHSDRSEVAAGPGKLVGAGDGETRIGAEDPLGR